jgi:putative membrane protein
MTRSFLQDGDKAALLDAVKDVERRSSAEVVVAVRGRSGPYLHADLIVGGLCACFTLWFQLFSPWEFALEGILLGPLAVGAATAILTAHTAPLRRLLTLPALRRERVRSAAILAFHEKGVTHTRERTGLLVYVSLLERAAEVIVDSGVTAKVPAHAWTEKVASIDAAVARGDNGTAVAARIKELGDVLEQALPRQADDVNELADEVGA